MPLDVGIGFVTGRKHFKNVLATYINNWLEHGLFKDNDIRLHLFIAYDLKYSKTEAGDYKNIEPELVKHVYSINYYGRKTIERERKILENAGVLTERESELLFGEGYAKKRNAVVYFARKNHMDRLIFLDDDEYPFAAAKNEYNKLVWMGQSVVGTHLNYSKDAGITHGHHCGYISPIPSIEFNEILSEDDFRLFIEAISNEIVSWDAVKTNIINNKGVTYANKKLINESHVYEIKEELGMKVVSGANLCFNFEKLPDLAPFYNPPGARGEDTFLSTCLTDVKVLKIPCYTFHDGFLTYKNLLKGILPTELHSVNYESQEIVKRFIKATIGWIRYKPLMVYISKPNEYDEIIEKVHDNLEKTIPKLCRYFNNNHFEEILPELAHYHKRVKVHYEAFQKTKIAWQKVLQDIQNPKKLPLEAYIKQKER